ncbi:MAG: hypothetical protein KC476_00330 [Cyanobacteria bacterium HKST-UBA06]|nr:hypothetical protein [Cyanobacteria bacterium HKST-UBA06]
MVSNLRFSALGGHLYHVPAKNRRQARASRRHFREAVALWQAFASQQVIGDPGNRATYRPLPVSFDFVRSRPATDATGPPPWQQHLFDQYNGKPPVEAGDLVFLTGDYALEHYSKGGVWYLEGKTPEQWALSRHREQGGRLDAITGLVEEPFGGVFLKTWPGKGLLGALRQRMSGVKPAVHQAVNRMLQIQTVLREANVPCNFVIVVRAWCDQPDAVGLAKVIRDHPELQDGDLLLVSGQLLDERYKPVPGAIVDEMSVLNQAGVDLQGVECYGDCDTVGA